MSRKSFLRNDLLHSAVLQKLSVIGEAASRLPLKFRTRHPEIEWGDIIGFRNIAVHAYFFVDWSIVWITARKEVPELRQKIAGILAAEYPKSIDS